MREGAFIIRWGTTAAGSRQSPVRPPGPCRAGQPADGLKRMSGRIPRRRGTPNPSSCDRARIRGSERQGKAGCPALLPLRLVSNPNLSTPPPLAAPGGLRPFSSARKAPEPSLPPQPDHRHRAGRRPPGRPWRGVANASAPRPLTRPSGPSGTGSYPGAEQENEACPPPDQGNIRNSLKPPSCAGVPKQVRGTTLTPARPAHPPNAGSSDKPLPDPATTLRPQAGTPRQQPRTRRLKDLEKTR